MTYGSQAAAASQVFEQQRDLALRDRDQQQLALVDAALARLDGGTFGACVRCGRPIAAGAARGAPVGRPLHRLPARSSTASADDASTPTTAASSASTRSAPPPSVLRGVAVRTPLVPFGPPEARRSSRPRASSRSARSRSAAPTTRSPSLPPSERARGVITYSSGNHAQGVARAARLLGAPAVVVMPSDAPGDQARAGRGRRRRGRRRRHRVSDERQAVAERIAAERGLAIIPPFDDDRIIAGQGTVGLEIAEDLPDVARGARPDRRRRAGERRRGGDHGRCARTPG